MSFLNYGRDFGSVLNLSPAPARFTPTVEGAIDEVMSGFERVFARPGDQPVSESDERGVCERIDEPTEMPNSNRHKVSGPSNVGESIAIYGPGVRFMLDPTKDLEPQIREAIGVMQILKQ
jgi:hypothetical protein